MTAVETERSPSVSSPVYVSFRTFQNLLDRLKKEGVPTRIDKSYLSNMAGGVQGILLTALRTLGLISADYLVLQPLQTLALAEDSERRQLIAELLRKQYRWAIELGSNATHLQLVEAFGKHGPRLSSNTREKAITFYLHASEYAGLPVSKFFKRKASAGALVTSTGRRQRRSRKPRADEGEPIQSPGDQLGTGDVDMRRRYLEMLIKRAEATNDPDEKLYDRIERLLAFQGGKPELG